jgi:hypothetical protein
MDDQLMGNDPDTSYEIDGAGCDVTTGIGAADVDAFAGGTEIEVWIDTDVADTWIIPLDQSHHVVVSYGCSGGL